VRAGAGALAGDVATACGEHRVSPAHDPDGLILSHHAARDDLPSVA
jgi:hypothetical protein